MIHRTIWHPLLTSVVHMQFFDYSFVPTSEYYNQVTNGDCPVPMSRSRTWSWRFFYAFPFHATGHSHVVYIVLDPATEDAKSKLNDACVQTFQNQPNTDNEPTKKQQRRELPFMEIIVFLKPNSFTKCTDNFCLFDQMERTIERTPSWKFREKFATVRRLAKHLCSL